MNKNTDLKFSRILLAIGFLLILAGLTFLILVPSSEAKNFFYIFYLALMFVSAAAIYSSLILQKGFMLYLALNTFIFSVIAAFITSNEANFPFIKYWPILVISFGLTLIPSGYVRANRMRTIYVIPAIVLVVLGLIFLLFSTGIIKTSFKDAVLFIWPTILFLAGVVLVALYFYGISKNKPLIDEVEVSTLADFEHIISEENENND